MTDVLSRARAGDRDALGALWNQHQHLVLRFLRGMGCAAPDDVASTVWIDVARSLPRFEGDLDAFRGWLFTIARRRMIDDLRRAVRRDEVLDADAGASRLADDAADDYDRAASLDRAIALVRTLPAEQAEVVLLRVVGELDVAEIAAIVGRSEGNVRVMVHRGLRRLADKIAVTHDQSPTMNRVP